MTHKIFTIIPRILFFTGLLLLTASALMVGARTPVDVETPQIDPVLSEKTISEDPCDEQIAGLDTVSCDEPMIRTITAYNTVPEQTDSTPCISANGTDICKGMAEGKHYVATNELPFGTLVEIAGTVYEVVDRMSEKYPNRYDITFPANDINGAKTFGKKILPITIVETTLQ